MSDHYYYYRVELHNEVVSIKAHINKSKYTPTKRHELNDVSQELAKQVKNVRRKGVQTKQPDLLKQVGEGLFNMLFAEDIASHFRDCLEQAVNDGAFLYFELR